MLGTFLSQNNKDSLFCARPVAAYASDSLWKNYGGLTMPFEQALKEVARSGEDEEEKEHLAISQF